jgi:endonuclease/exonuclease/phosphatase family metal-dependent hydrolase
MKLQVHQCSLHAEGDPAEVPAQVKAALGRGALAVGFTELSHGADIDAVYRLCGEHDYVLYKGANDTAIAWDSHAALVGKGETATGASRSLVWVTLDYQGERVTFVEQHWVTGGYDRTGATRAKQSKAMIQAVTSKAGGRDVVFWMGDTNANFANYRDVIRSTLGKAGLVSAFEARNDYLPTLGKHTCDVVGHYTADTRVHCTDVKTYSKLGSDHSPVSGFYTIDS